MARSVRHFSLRDDALALLGKLEKTRKLFFVLERWFRSPEPPVYHSASDIPNLGIATVPAQLGADCYLVYDHVVKKIVLQETSGPDGVIWYSVNVSKMPPFVFFTCGGLFEDECMISGIIETAWGDKRTLSLYRAFVSALKNLYIHVPDPYDVYIGPQALELRKAGLRFTQSKGMVRSQDIKWKPPKSKFEFRTFWRGAERVS